MHLIYLPFCGLVIVTTLAYQLTCPDQSQRRFRHQNCTSRGVPKYICLLDVNYNTYKEYCAYEVNGVRKGFKKIRMPGITDGNCTKNRYQPIAFFANKFSDCMYIKSSCEEEGQVVTSDKTGYQDRACRCDYRAGYNYIIQPRNLCACVPSEEDCSCVKKYCGRNEILSEDYRCVPDNKLTLTVCSKISTPLFPGTTSPSPGITSLQQLPISTFTESSTVNASVAIVLILLFGMVVVILLKLRVFPELTSYIAEFEEASCVINRDDKTQTYTVLEGCKVKIDSSYKSLLPCGEIRIKDVTSGLMLRGEREVKKKIKFANKSKSILNAVERQSSFVVPYLTKDYTQIYELVLKNKMYLPHSVMEKWKRFHARLGYLIYEVEDHKEDSSSYRFEFIIPTIPESYKAVDVLYGKKIELQIHKLDDMSGNNTEDMAGHNVDDKLGHNTDDKSGLSTDDMSGQDVDDKPGLHTDEKLGHNTEDISGHNTNGKSGQDINDKSLQNTDGQSGHNTDDKSGHNTNGKSGYYMDDKVGHNIDDMSGHNTDETSGHNADEKSGLHTDDKLGYNTDDKSGQNTDDKSGQNTDDKSGHNTDNKSGHNTLDKSGYYTDDKAGHNTDDKSGRNTDVTSGHHTVDASGHNTNDKSGHVTDHKSGYRTDVESEHTSDYCVFVKSGHLGDVKKVIWFKLDRTETPGGFKYLDGDILNKSLIINSICMRDGGRYICFVVNGEGKVSSCGLDLRVIPQESAYNELKQHRQDEDYVDISVVSDAMKCLEKNGVVVLKGREGTGKTKMSLELASLLEKEGYLLVMVKSEEDISVEFDKSKILYIFDQSSDLPGYWCDHLKRFLSNITTNRLSCKAVFTSRHLNFPDLKDCKLLGETTVDLNERLTENDKKCILDVYMKKNNVKVVSSKESNFKQIEIINDKTKIIKLDDDAIQMITNTEPLQGFPLMARKFCESRPYLHLGEKYFKDPPADVIQKIKKVVDEASKDTAGLHEILRLVVLVYITLSDDQILDTSDLNYEKLRQIKKMLLRNDTHKLPQTANDKIIEAIKVAANSLVGDYLTGIDNVYKLIHPYYRNAVVLTSDDFVHYVIQKSSVEIILEYIRGNKYVQKEGESVLKVEEKYLHVLCERLVREFVEGREASDIGKYIYHCWVRSYDFKFCQQLFDHLGALMGATRNDDKNEIEVKIKMWQVLLLIKHLTCYWNDLKICSSDDTHDIVIILGLLSLCQLTPPTKTEQEKEENVENEKFGKAIETLLDILRKRLSVKKESNSKKLSSTKKSDGKRLSITKETDGKRLSNTKEYVDDGLGNKLVASLDQHGNTFFHYLVLFNEDIACRILECCCKHVKKEWTVTNVPGYRPIDIAVALGKPKLSKLFIQAYKDIKCKITKDQTSNCLQGKKAESTEKQFNILESFDSEISRSIVSGNEDDYEELKNLLH